MKTLIALTTALLIGSGLDGRAQEAKDAPKKSEKPDAKIVADQLPSYPLDTCVVSEEGLHDMGEPLDYIHEGRLVRLCCKGCIKGLKRDAEGALAKLDAAVVEAQKASYPLETCPISGEKLGGMGEPIDFVHGTRLVRLCCKHCTKEVAKSPKKYLEKVDAALIAQQKKAYPLDACPVGGDKLGEDAVDHLYGTRLVRFCCKRCVKSFRSDPDPVLAKLDAAGGQKGM